MSSRRGTHRQWYLRSKGNKCFIIVQSSSIEVKPPRPFPGDDLLFNSAVSPWGIKALTSYEGNPGTVGQMEHIWGWVGEEGDEGGEVKRPSNDLLSAYMPGTIQILCHWILKKQTKTSWIQELLISPSSGGETEMHLIFPESWEMGSPGSVSVFTDGDPGAQRVWEGRGDFLSPSLDTEEARMRSLGGERGARD